MTNDAIPTNSFLKTLIVASAGTTRNFRISFWGQVIMGFLYSFGYFNLRIVGLTIGFILPVIWVTCTYRLLKAKANHFSNLPFPSWMQNDPGNALVIIFDIFFLALIWFFILTGAYDQRWLKIMFTIAFPLLTLVMLKNLIIFNPSESQDQNQEKKEDHRRDNYLE